MKTLRPFLSLLLSFSLLLSVPASAYARQPQRYEQLLSLREQTRRALSARPERTAYLRQLLTLSAGAALVATLSAAAQTQQTQLALADIRARLQTALRQNAAAPLKGAQRHLFAKKQSNDAWMGSLFDEVEEAAAPAAKPAPQTDLSWLDEPFEKPAPAPKTGSLFPEQTPAPTKAEPKTYLSKRIMKQYEPRLSRLPLAEQQGLVEMLDEAVLRKKKYGYASAIRFLEQKSYHTAHVSLYLIIAKRMLLLTGIFVVTDYFLHAAERSAALQRLAANPLLLADAADEDLAVLAADPQAVPLCQSIAQAATALADMELSAQERQFIESLRLQTLPAPAADLAR